MPKSKSSLLIFLKENYLDKNISVMSLNLTFKI